MLSVDNDHIDKKKELLLGSTVPYLPTLLGVLFHPPHPSSFPVSPQLFQLHLQSDSRSAHSIMQLLPINVHACMSLSDVALGKMLLI